MRITYYACKMYNIWIIFLLFILTEGIVSNSGDNLSSGQKQLLCLARAILQDNICLIMDEPTSSVDDETENKLLEAIKKSFNGRTVITIAVITIYLNAYKLTICIVHNILTNNYVLL